MGDTEPQEIPVVEDTKENDEANKVADEGGSQKAESKASSARSKSERRPTTAKSQRSSKSGSGRASPAKSSAREKSSREKSAKKSEKSNSIVPETPSIEQNILSGPLPDGCIPIFLSGPTQQIFALVADEDVTPTAPNKLIKKEDILKDFHNRAAVSDFSVLKDVINNYPGEEILLVYDFDFKYGENFVIATTEAAKEIILAPPKREEGEDGELAEPEEEVIHRYVPPEPKEWISLGSEYEIEEDKVTDTRPRIKMLFSRKRREFGAPCTFTDRNVGDAKDGSVEIASYEDRAFDVKIMLKDKNESSVADRIDIGTQTEWKYPVNAHTQYVAREMSAQQKEEICTSENLKTSAEESLQLFVQALQHNEIMNLFYDDYANLSEGDGTFDSRADNTLKEYQSFTDLKFSKDKAVTHIDWHPSIKGLVAMSLGEKMTFDQRVDNASKVIMSPSLIILWSFADPIQPQLLLEAPDDIFCFQFCPSDPHLIAGGCINGQVVLWDIEKHMEELKNIKTKLKSKHQRSFLPGFDDDSSMKVPIMRYCAVSSIEYTHLGPVTDLQWVPDHFEVTRMGIPIETKSQQCVQLMTAAIDHSVNFWDIRPPKGPQLPDKFKDAHKAPMGVPDTFKYLDLKWKPHLKVHLFKSEPGGDHAPTKFSIAEAQGDRSVLQSLVEEAKENLPSAPGFSFGKPGSAKQRTLDKLKTHMYVGTEDGELVYVDWMPQKDQDTGKVQTTKPDFYCSLHDGPIVSLTRSPFDSEVILVVGGWMWSLWKESVNSGPIISSCAAPKPLTGGAWSPTRPSIFFIIRSDGCVEVWDLLDKTHEPILVQNISSSALTVIRPWNMSGKQQLLAIGDTNGTLHVFQVPNRLRQPAINEHTNITAAIAREVQRRHFVVSRWNFREHEKMEKEQEAKRKAGIAPQVLLSDEEIIAKMKMEYDAFLEDELAFLRELGLKDEDEPLPQVD